MLLALCLLYGSASNHSDETQLQFFIKPSFDRLPQRVKWLQAML